MKKEPPITVTLRIAKVTKHLLQAAAEKDHRSMANMVEALIHRHCEAHGICVSPKRTNKKKI
jgi:hypothetical protein